MAEAGMRWHSVSSAAETTGRSQALTSTQRMDQFLAGMERRAFRRAELATNNAADALDIVQEAMFRLVRKYADRGPEHWEPLFHRILQTCILDWHRRTQVRNRWRSWLTGRGEEEAGDPLQEMADEEGRSPEALSAGDQEIARIEEALRLLPLRQQQAFLLRAWDGLSVEQTATAMGCSTGSVKTHYARARQQLRQRLGEEEA